MSAGARTLNLGRDPLGRSIWLKIDGNRLTLTRKAGARQGDAVIDLTAEQLRDLVVAATEPQP